MERNKKNTWTEVTTRKQLQITPWLDVASWQSHHLISLSHLNIFDSLSGAKFSTILGWSFCDFWNNQVQVSVISQQRLKAEADNTNSISNTTQMKWKKTTTLKMSWNCNSDKGRCIIKYLFKYQQGNDRLPPQKVTQQVLKFIQGFSGEISRYVACE